MTQRWLKLKCHYFTSIIFIVVFFGVVNCAFADLYINILAVNGSDRNKEKDIKYTLPKDLTAEDILDTAGLTLDYDVNQAAYVISGKVNLNAKETKTFKVRIRDIWRVEEKQVEDIKKQIDENLKRIQNTEYFDVGKIRKESLLQRLNFIAAEQEKFADNVETRIDRYRTYADELSKIRNDAVSISYWRTKAPEIKDSSIFKFVIEVVNASEKPKTSEEKHYLPAEVKPEHIVDLQGFDIHYDPNKSQSYLSKNVELLPNERKRFEIGIFDIWNVNQTEIENLKSRTSKAHKLLENSEYIDSANYLVANIKENLDKIEASQNVERNIYEHISAFRVNQKRFESAETDVKALEDLLEALRENLERSQLKNVLKKVTSLKSVADIAEAIFGTKPSANTAWKIIAGIMIFVGGYTFMHFIVWGRRSKDKKQTDIAKKDAKTK